MRTRAEIVGEARETWGRLEHLAKELNDALRVQLVTDAVAWPRGTVLHLVGELPPDTRELIQRHAFSKLPLAPLTLCGRDQDGARSASTSLRRPTCSGCEAAVRDIEDTMREAAHRECGFFDGQY